MEIRVTSASKVENNHILASFTSEYGPCEAWWEGTPPVPGLTYDCEVNIEDELVWNVNSTATDMHAYKLRKENGYIKIAVEVESVDEENLCVLKLGTSILMAEIKDVPPLKRGSFVEMKVKAIRIFDSNL